MIRIRVLAGGLLAAALALGCGDSIEPGTDIDAFVVALATPHQNDGAIMITLRGPDLATVQAASAGYLVYGLAMSGEEARLIVIGDLEAGPLLSIQLGASHPPSAYSASIEQIATRSDSLRSVTAGYRVTIE